MINTKRVTKTATFIALAVMLGYIESLFPPIMAGVKLGLANCVVITVIYTEGWRQAWVVSLLKVILCMTLFGSMTSFIYSLSGAVVSLIIMLIARKSGLFSLIAVSSLGGLFHNMAQLACAYFIIGKGVLLHLPVLCLSGLLCGVLTGIAAQIIIKRGRDIFGKD